MRKKILFILLLVCSFMFVPDFIDARTLDEAKELAESFGVPYNTINEIELPVVNFNDIISKSCDGITDADDLNFCKDNVMTTILNYYFKGKDDSVQLYTDFSVSYDLEGEIGMVDIYYLDDDNQRQVLTKRFMPIFSEYDEDIYESTEGIISEIDKDFVLYGYNTISSYYHYGNFFDNDLKNPSNLLLRFSELKNILINNPEFEYELTIPLGGTTGPTGSSLQGGILLLKDGIIYGYKDVYFILNSEFFVDKDEDGTAYSKAISRLNKFFNNKVEVDIDVLEYDVDFEGYFTELSLDGKKYPLFVKEVSKDELDKYEVKTNHKYTGIFMETESYDVPTDAILDIESKKGNKDIVKAFNAKKFKLLDAYDINIVKNTDGSLVEEVDGGVIVYIPINGKKVGDKVKVFHVTDENIVGEEFLGEVVEVDGKKYVKFTAPHFSTYALAENEEIETEENKEVVVNPNTSDNILLYVVMLICSGCFLVTIRRMNKVN